MSDDRKWSPIPASYVFDHADLDAAREFGRERETVFERVLADMQEREAESLAERVWSDHQAFVRSLEGLKTPPSLPRTVEYVRPDGERMFLVLPEPEPMTIQMSWDMPKQDPMRFLFQMDLDPMRFALHHRLGGMIQRDPARVIVTSLPLPTAPGVEAMLADGWTWTGWRFARDQQPRWGFANVRAVEVERVPNGSDVYVRTGPEGDPLIGAYRGDDAGGDAILVPGMRWVDTWGSHGRLYGKIGRWEPVAAGRHAGVITDDRATSGRYAERLPTNRKRKRERAKARRRARRTPTD